MRSAEARSDPYLTPLAGRGGRELRASTNQMDQNMSERLSPGDRILERPLHLIPT